MRLAPTTTGATLFEKRYGRARWRSSSTISLRPATYPPLAPPTAFPSVPVRMSTRSIDVEVRVGAATARADEPDGVRVVDQDECVVPLGEVADRVELGRVAVHREDAVGRDQPEACVGGLVQPRLELVHVAVRVAEPPRLAEADAVDDRRVVQLVGDHGVPLVEQRLEDAAVGVEARAEQDRVLRAEERREALLQLAVERLRAADEPHRGHPVPPAVERLVRGGDHLGVVREAEVVVRAEVEQLAALLHRDVRALRRRHHELPLEQSLVGELGEPRGQVVAQRAVHGCQASLQSRSTFPASPEAATANASSNPVNGKRCVITGETSRPESIMTLIWYQVSYISRP